MKLIPVVSRLQGPEAAQLLAQHPDLREQVPIEAPGDSLSGVQAEREESLGLPLVLLLSARDRAEADELADVITVARQLLRERNATIHDVLRALLPEQRLALAPGQSRQVQREAEARAEVADRYGLLSSTQVADQAHSTATNRAALASRWRSEGRLLSVTIEGNPRFPGFQFDDQGRPHAVVGQVLQALRAHLSSWDITLWFTAANDWLGGITPADALQGPPQDHQAVQYAAHQLAAELDNQAQGPSHDEIDDPRRSRPQGGAVSA